MLCRLNKRLLTAACLLSELVVADLRFDVSQGLSFWCKRCRGCKNGKRSEIIDEKKGSVMFFSVWRPQKKKFLLLSALICCFILISERWNTLVYCLKWVIVTRITKDVGYPLCSSVVHVLCLCDRILDQGPITYHLLGSFSFALFTLDDVHKLVCVLITIIYQSMHFERYVRK